MAETEELKQMVLSYRRSELVDLLGFVGMNKNGVKATLLQRAVALVNSSRGCSVPVQIKIRDLYRQIHNPYASEPARSRSGARSQPQVADPRARRYASSSGKVPSSQIPGSSLGQTGAVDYTKRPQEMPSGASSLPVHPDVRFKPLPFYDIMGELLKPTSLAPKGMSRYQETYFVFHLTPQQAQDIAMSRDFRPSAKWEYTVQAQLRFCFLETSCEQDDNFPPSICVRVNGKVATLPNPIPTTKPGVEPKRPGRPVDITSLCRLSPTMPNHVEISWASEYGRGFVVSINLVKRQTSDILLHRLKQCGNRHADHSRAMIKEKLQHDADSEIATTSLRVSLTCPLGKMRMQLPTRATTCTHLQCFDATTFLMMNEKKATWVCPVCDKQAPFHKLIIDGLFVEILRSVSDTTEIQFVEDGSWSCIKDNKETHTIGPPTPSASKHSHTSIDPATVEPVPPTKKPKTEVIDLTLSDSEDDDDDMARPPSTHAISSECVSPPVINIDSPAGPLSISSGSSFMDSPAHFSSRSNSSFSPNLSSPNLSSSPSPSSSSNSTIGYNYPGPSRTPPQAGTPPRLRLSPRSPYKSPLQSPVSPSISPHHMASLGDPTNPFLPPFPSMPLPLSLSMAGSMPGMYVPPSLGAMHTMNDDTEINDFINRLTDGGSYR